MQIYSSYISLGRNSNMQLSNPDLLIRHKTFCRLGKADRHCSPNFGEGKIVILRVKLEESIKNDEIFRPMPPYENAAYFRV